jgi:hypothetical protein
VTVTTFRRCSRCCEEKPLETGFYASGTRRGVKQYHYLCKQCEIQRVGESKKWQRQVDPGFRERENAQTRARRARNRDKVRENQRRYLQELQADPVRHAAYLETRRIAHRLRRERRDGIPADQIRNGPRLYEDDGDARGGWLPVLPLLPFIDRALAQTDDDPDMGATPRICARLGIDERTLYAWRNERSHMRWSLADRVLTRLGVNWWDVWTAEDVAGTPYEPTADAA